MGDIENFNEIIDDLKDEVHDLEHDLRASEKECDRLREEITESIEDQDLSEAAHKKEIALLQNELGYNQGRVLEMKRDFSVLNGDYEKMKYKYFKALSIAETLHNGNTEYFKTADGRTLLNWGVNELKEEARKHLA